MGRGLVVLGMLLLTHAAAAGEVEGTVRVRLPDGGTALPQEPVVVYLTGFTQPPPSEVPVISQKDKTFLPGLRVLVAGQSLAFTNDDPWVHNVFSTSRARAFDLGTPGPGQTRVVAFPNPGLVEVYCNLHEAMNASVLVLPNRAFTWVDAQGHFLLTQVPVGTHPVHAFGRHFDPVEAQVSVPAAGSVHVALTASLRLTAVGHLDKHGRPYRTRAGYAP